MFVAIFKERCDPILDVVKSGNDLLYYGGVLFDTLRGRCAVREFLADLVDPSFCILIKWILGDCITVLWSEGSVIFLLLD